MGDVQSALVECPQRIEPMTTYSKREKLKPLIRIVDDNQAILNSLTFMLTCEGYEVASFSSAEAFLAGDTPSREGLLILDVQMPGLSGLELFKVLNMRAYKLPTQMLTWLLRQCGKAPAIFIKNRSILRHCFLRLPEV